MLTDQKSNDVAAVGAGQQIPKATVASLRIINPILIFFCEKLLGLWCRDCFPVFTQMGLIYTDAKIELKAAKALARRHKEKAEATAPVP